jgi:hypothetical protein
MDIEMVLIIGISNALVLYILLRLSELRDIDIPVVEWESMSNIYPMDSGSTSSRGKVICEYCDKQVSSNRCNNCGAYI